MKDLELHIYDEYHGTYSRQEMVDGINYLSFHMPTKAKRLTSVEITCEYLDMRNEHLLAVLDGYKGLGKYKIRELRETSRKAEILKRFAQLPHFDEDPDWWKD